MEQKKYIGYHNDAVLPIKRGQTVTIKKGTKIRCMLRGDVVAGRTFKIQVHHLMPGCSYHKNLITECDLRVLGMTFEEVRNYPEEFIPQKNPEVCWPGRGGYWQSVDINDVPETFTKE